jgi:hypothetical protein
MNHRFHLSKELSMARAYMTCYYNLININFMSEFNYFSKFTSVPAYSIPKSNRKINSKNIPGPG